MPNGARLAGAEATAARALPAEGLPRFGQWALVRPVGDVTEMLLRLAVAEQILWRWPSAPSVEGFYSVLDAPNSESYVIVDLASSAVVGHCGIYSFHAIHRTAFFEASLVPELRYPHSMAGGVVLVALRSLLNRFDLRKLYFETTDARRDQFAFAEQRGYITEEARLRNHVFAEGTYKDVLILSAEASELRRALSEDQRLLHIVERGARSSETGTAEAR